MYERINILQNRNFSSTFDYNPTTVFILTAPISKSLPFCEIFFPKFKEFIVQLGNVSVKY